MNSNLLSPSEYAPFYGNYVRTLEGVDLVEELEINLNALIHYVQAVPMDKIDYQYAPGKWTLKDIILHLIDAERVFSYRALRIARQDQTPLPGFDENDYAQTAGARQRTVQSLLSEWSAVRYSTLALFKSFDEKALLSVGIAAGHPISVRALGFIMIGHARHHMNVFTERYL